MNIKCRYCNVSYGVRETHGYKYKCEVPGCNVVYHTNTLHNAIQMFVDPEDVKPLLEREDEMERATGLDNHRRSVIGRSYSVGN